MIKRIETWNIVLDNPSAFIYLHWGKYDDVHMQHTVISLFLSLHFRPKTALVYNCTTGGINPFHWGEIGVLHAFITYTVYTVIYIHCKTMLCIKQLLLEHVISGLKIVVIKCWCLFANIYVNCLISKLMQ